MPAIVATSAAQGSPRASTRTILTATGNPIAYTPGARQLLVLHNPTAGPLSPTIIGSAAASGEYQGLGTVNPAAGLALGAIAAGAQIIVPLDFIDQYLRGTIDITGGTGLAATLLNP
jgi:hypothetical protein